MRVWMEPLRISTDYKQLQWFESSSDISDHPTIMMIIIFRKYVSLYTYYSLEFIPYKYIAQHPLCRPERYVWKILSSSLSSPSHSVSSSSPLPTLSYFFTWSYNHHDNQYHRCWIKTFLSSSRLPVPSGRSTWITIVLIIMPFIADIQWSLLNADHQIIHCWL